MPRPPTRTRRSPGARAAGGCSCTPPRRVTHGVGHPGLVAPQLRPRGRGRALDLFLIAGDRAGRHPRALHLAHRPAAAAAALEPRRLVLARLLPGCGRGARARRAGCARRKSRRTSSCSTARPGRTTQTRFRFEFDPARYPDPKAVLDELHALNFKVCVWEYPMVSRARAAVRRVRGQGLAAQGPGDRPRRRARLGRGVVGPALAAAAERADRFHPSRCVCLLARRPRQAVRARRRRDQDRLRRAGAGRLRRACDAPTATSCTTPTRCSISAASSRRPSARAARASSSPAPAGRAASASRPIGAAIPQADWEALAASMRGALSWGALGRRLLRHRRRRLSRAAGCRALRPLGPGRGLRLAPALPRHEPARALGVRRRARGHRPQLARASLPADPLSRGAASRRPRGPACR